MPSESCSDGIICHSVRLDVPTGIPRVIKGRMSAMADGSRHYRFTRTPQTERRVRAQIAKCRCTLIYDISGGGEPRTAAQLIPYLRLYDAVLAGELTEV